MLARSTVLHRGRRGFIAFAATGFLLLAGLLLPVAAQAGTQDSPHCSQVPAPVRSGRFLGVVPPAPTGPRCGSPSGGTTSTTSGAASGTPPLLDHGGPVMSAPDVGSTVKVTPIFWSPSGHPISAGYESIVHQYLVDSAADSDTVTNVFSTLTQYAGSNGRIRYRMTAGPSIIDTNGLPASDCTVDTGSIYADASGYDACLSDVKVEAEIGNVLSAHGLTSDLGHMYLLFLPKGVESCFYSGTPAGQACSINPTPTAAYCGYHSGFGNSAAPTIYGTFPYPIYSSATGHTCTDEGLGAHLQSPTGNLDADVILSVVSHEVSESITDPLGNTWYDASGYENGDECAYTYGTLSGTDGAFYNQTINGHHYLTQMEFSNDDFVADGGGCIQQEEAAPVPVVTAVAPSSGPAAGGTPVTVTGTGFTGAVAVTFGATPATSYTVTSDTSISATAPAGTGAVDVRVRTPGGQSATGSGDTYTYLSIPHVGTVSPSSGPTAGGTHLTLGGSGFLGALGVTVGGVPVSSFSVVNGGSLTAVAPPHSAGVTDVVVTGPAGTSATGSGDRFTYLAAPTVTSLSPTSGTHSGGTILTIHGSGFTSGASVKFGSVSGRGVRVAGPGRLTVSSPPHARGRVDVRVTTRGGTSKVVTADRFTFR